MEGVETEQGHPKGDKQIVNLVFSPFLVWALFRVIVPRACGLQACVGVIGDHRERTARSGIKKPARRLPAGANLIDS